MSLLTKPGCKQMVQSLGRISWMSLTCQTRVNLRPVGACQVVRPQLINRHTSQAAPRLVPLESRKITVS